MPLLRQEFEQPLRLQLTVMGSASLAEIQKVPRDVVDHHLWVWGLSEGIEVHLHAKE